jgi:hypothetical protein
MKKFLTLCLLLMLLALCIVPVSADGPIPGDLDGNGSIDNQDVEFLLWHTLFPEDYPLTANGDLTGDGEVNNEDVALLLWHTLFPEAYPL